MRHRHVEEPQTSEPPWLVKLVMSSMGVCCALGFVLTSGWEGLRAGEWWVGGSGFGSRSAAAGSMLRFLMGFRVNASAGVAVVLAGPALFSLKSEDFVWPAVGMWVELGDHLVEYHQ